MLLNQAGRVGLVIGGLRFSKDGLFPKAAEPEIGFFAADGTLVHRPTVSESEDKYVRVRFLSSAQEQLEEIVERMSPGDSEYTRLKRYREFSRVCCALAVLQNFVGTFQYSAG